MNLLLAFAPFVAFVIFERVLNVPLGLVTGAIVAMMLILRDLFHPTRSVKLLEVGTALLFASLATYTFFHDAQWSIAAVRLRVDGGLTLIVLISMALRQPFTLQYAREKVDRTLWTSPRFLRVNYVLSGAWAFAFALITLADLLMAYVPQVPHAAGIVLTVVTIVAALRFTSWYPRRGEERVAVQRT
jgi:hypothetical protein